MSIVDYQRIIFSLIKNLVKKFIIKIIKQKTLFIISCITKNSSNFTFVNFMKAFTKCNKIIRQDNELLANYRRENYSLEFIACFHFSEP